MHVLVETTPLTSYFAPSRSIVQNVKAAKPVDDAAGGRSAHLAAVLSRLRARNETQPSDKSGLTNKFVLPQGASCLCLKLVCFLTS